MKDRSRLKIKKMLMTAAVLVLMLALCGCRTRISNNTEVASTISDDDGYLQEMYDARRSELDMPVAKKPFITGSSEDDDDDYDYEGTDAFDDYAPDPWEDEYDEEDDDDGSDSTGTSGSTTTTNRPSSTQSSTRRTTRPVTRRTTNTSSKKTTKKSTGTTTETTETETKTYTVYFDGNGADMGGASITVSAGGTYGTLPSAPEREEYTFEGWYTEAEGGTKIESGTTFSGSSDQTLYAHWTKKDPEVVWGNRFDVAANEQTEKTDCLIQGENPEKAKKSLVESCKGNTTLEEGANPKCVIAFIEVGDDTDLAETAGQLYDLYKNGSEEQGIAANDGLQSVIVLSDDSIYGSDREKLLYKLALLDALYGSFGSDEIDRAAQELGLSEYFMAIYRPE